MDKNTFWGVIDSVNTKADPRNQEAILQATKTALIAFPPRDILDWHNIKDVYMKLADRPDLWAACTATHSHDSDDGFIDLRSWLISQGKEVYMAALADPDSLAGLDVAEGACDFEAYGYVASDAYASKMALESEGFEGILLRYTAWTAKNSDDILHRLVQRGLPCEPEDRPKIITEAFFRVLSRQYDIYDALDQHTLGRETVVEIEAEIPATQLPHPEWSLRERLENIPVTHPRLWEKYSVHPDTSQNIQSGDEMTMA